MNIYLGLVYCVVCIIRLYFLPDDEIKLPDEITYINDLAECKNDYWMLELYTTFSPACQRVAPVFADLSRQYGCDKLKFGKGLLSATESDYSLYFSRCWAQSSYCPKIPPQVRCNVSTNSNHGSHERWRMCRNQTRSLVNRKTPPIPLF